MRLTFLVTVLILSVNAIFDGDEVLSNYRWPFMAAIFVQTNTTRFFCGGAFFSYEWIITAGQCVDGATQFTIQLGAKDLNGTNPERVIVNSTEYVLHPDFNPQTLENDIGLIKIERFTLTASTTPIDWLPNRPLDNETIVSIFGWGQMGNDGPLPVNTLQWDTVTALNNDDCKAFYGDQITDNMVCVAGNIANTRTCNGDSGGPLFQYYGSVSVIVGIASFISGNGCEDEYPSGFTRTYPYNDWLRNITNHM